jgi:hypothetical protein
LVVAREGPSLDPGRGLEGFSNGAMEMKPSRSDQVPVQGLADQGVTEAVASFGFLDDSRLFEFRELLPAETCRPPRDFEAEALPTTAAAQ